MPPVSIFATRRRNTVNTTIKVTGVIRDQANPRNVCL